jgi:hypothetical protein
MHLPFRNWSMSLTTRRGDHKWHVMSLRKANDSGMFRSACYQQLARTSGYKGEGRPRVGMRSVPSDGTTVASGAGDTF